MESITEVSRRETATAPFWSVMIPTYNPKPFFADTLRSALAQDPGAEQMQICVVDDGSTSGDPEAVVREIARQRISVIRNERNLGLAGNWNACIRHARGQWIHIMHQDDVVLPGYYESIRAGVEANPHAGLAFTRCANFDAHGNWIHLSRLERPTAGIVDDWLSRVAINNRIQCPAVSVRADVYRAVGGFRDDLVYAIDWEMWCRIAAKYAVWFDPHIRMSYRVHEESETARLQALSLTTADERRAIAIINNLLPSAIRRSCRRKALLKLANRELDIADAHLDRGAHRDALKSVTEALKTGWRFPSVAARAMCCLSVVSCPWSVGRKEPGFCAYANARAEESGRKRPG